MIQFVVMGLPRPKGSIRSFLHRSTGRLVSTSTTVGLKEWQAAIAGEARANIGEVDPGPVAVACLFTFARPASWPSRRRTEVHHQSRPDLDKLVRAVLDALTGIAYHDDSQVSGLLATKQIGTADGVTVLVGPADEVVLSARAEQVPLGI